jgi:hypothetical protein
MLISIETSLLLEKGMEIPSIKDSHEDPKKEENKPKITRVE